jgi:hydrogenase maturation protein HypF
MAGDAAREHGYETVALSGGVAYNEAIRTKIQRELDSYGLTVLIPSSYPLGDGCISYGQCRYASNVL